eukprot:5532890-Prymnesium_polylepis.1
MLRYGDADEHEIYHAVMRMMSDDAFWHECCVVACRYMYMAHMMAGRVAKVWYRYQLEIA